jgi:hypothetical protein
VLAQHDHKPDSDDAHGQVIAYFVRHGFSYLPIWQFLGGIIMLQLVWLNEIIDFSALFLGRASSPPNIFRGCLLSACVLVVMIITVGHTYLQQQRLVKGLLTICSYCRKIRISQSAWEQIEAYISRHSELKFSHGVCPECYKKVTDELTTDEQDEV